MLRRRIALVLPILLAGCGGREEREYPPLRYDYLTPLQLNVSTIRVDQRYVPAGADVTRYDPVTPLQALRAMAQDRLQALGSADLAVFVIRDASLVRHGDTLTGSLSVELDIYDTPTNRAGYAQANVTSSFTGDLDDLPSRLYDMTKDMMDRMNVEFEYQLRRSLGHWLLPPGAVQAPVQQQPLMPGSTAAPPSAMPPPPSVQSTAPLPPPTPMPTTPQQLP